METTQIQLKRGNTAYQRSSSEYVLAAGECYVDLYTKYKDDNNNDVTIPTLYIGDGTTQLKNLTGVCVARSLATSYAYKSAKTDAFTSSAGSSTIPVYINSNGVPTQCSFSVQTSVPANAEFTDHIYEAGTNISIAPKQGTTNTYTVTNTGVRAVSKGSSNGTISVNTNGTASDVAVKGLGTAAYENISKFAQLSSATVGGTTKPVYVSNGVVTALSSNIGGDGTPVYISGGSITAFSQPLGTAAYKNTSNFAQISSNSIGADNKPVFISNGSITAISNTLGGAAYKDVSNFAQITSTNVGSASYPVYVSDGVVTQGSRIPAIHTGSGTPSATTGLNGDIYVQI